MSLYTEETAPAAAEKVRPEESGENYGARKKRALDEKTRKQVERLDRHVCRKINDVFLLNDDTARVRADRLYARGKSLRRQDKAMVKARHYVWFFLYHHPVFGMGLQEIAALTGWDHSTVCYGVQKMRHLLQERPYSIDAAALFELSKELAPLFGAMDIFTAAQPRRRGRR